MGTFLVPDIWVRTSFISSSTTLATPGEQFQVVTQNPGADVRKRATSVGFKGQIDERRGSIEVATPSISDVNLTTELSSLNFISFSAFDIKDGLMH